MRKAALILLIFTVLFAYGCGKTNNPSSSSSPAADPSTVPSAPAQSYILTSLSLSSGTLSPVFSSSVYDYAVTVGNSISNITVTPTASGSGGLIKVNGSAVTSGSASGAITLAVGANTISIDVKNNIGQTTSYGIVVTRESAASTPSPTPTPTPTYTYNLTGLTLSNGTLSPSFATAVVDYTSTVTNGVSSINVTPTAAGDGGTITVNGTAVSSGNTSGSIGLNVGSNTITVAITPTGGSATTYTITVTRLAAAPANTYYVSTTGSNSTGNGSQSTPWATPGYGVSQLQAGDTLIILGGTYIITDYNDDRLIPQNSGTSGSPITIQGETGNRPVLAARNTAASASSAGLGQIVDLNSKSYITINNIEFTHDPTASGTEVYVRDCIAGNGDHITLEDLYIHHVDQFGVNIQDVDTFTIRDCVIEYCGFGGIGSPDMGAGGGWKNIIIDGCDLSYNGHYWRNTNGLHDDADPNTNPYSRPDGIGLEEGPGPIEVKNCLFEHNRGDGIDLKIGNAYVHENIVANNSCDGIKLWAGTTTVENNLVYGTMDGDSTSAAWVALVIGAPAGETFIIQNNTFHCNPQRNHYISTIQYDEKSDINLTLRNNIFSNAAGTLYIDSNVSSYTIDNNLFDRVSSSYEIEIGGSALTVAQLNSLTNCENNIEAVPSFVSPAWGATGNYHLNSGSAGIDQGTSTGMPSADLDGISRPRGGVVDIGAYER